MAYLGCAVLLPVALVAQNDDRGLLQRTLEDALSDAGRSVQIIGFEGALSSKATVEEITIADDTGVWLTLKSVELDWVRSALLRGRVEVNTLKAAEILLPRLPPAGSGSAPAPEASGFQLPELPVAVNIAEVSAGRVVLGAPVLGVAATLALNGALTLEGGSGAADIVAERIDGARGRFQVDAGFNNATRELRTAISLSEAAGGIAATLIGLPGAPAIDLELLGEAPLSEFEASLALRTDGSDRLAGTVTLGRGSDVDGAPTQTFAADISGDIAPLFLPDYRAFFGPQIALTAAGTRFADGRVSLGALALRAAAVELDGELRLGADGVPVFVDIDGRIAAPDGAPVLLPLAGTPTHVGRADLAVSLDADAGDRWTAGVTVAGLDRPDVRARALALDGRGTITRDGLVATAAEAVFDFRAEALDLASEAAEDALGEAVTGRAEVSWRAAEPLVIRALQLSGETYELSASGQLVTEERDLAISGSAKVAARDLSVVSGLVGRPLSGAAEAELEGEGDLLGGRFSGQLSASTRDMTVDLAELDALTEGDATLRIVAARDETGTRVDSLSIASDHAQISGSGALSSGPGNLTLAAEVRDASRLQPDLSGPLTLSVEAATEMPEGPWQGRVSASGLGADALADGALTLDDVPDYRGALSVEATDLEAFRPLLGRPISGALSLAVDGQMQLDLQLFELAATLTGSDLQTGIGDLDGLLTGPSTASMSARRDGDAFAVDGFQAETGVLVASGNAVIGGAENAVALNGQIKDIAPFVAELSGPVDLVLSATQTDGADWNVDASADGAAGTRVEIGGSVAPDFATTDVAISGLAPLAVADRFIAPRSLAGNARFALRLNGAPGLPALSGTVKDFRLMPEASFSGM